MLAWAAAERPRRRRVGLGSNLLVADEGYDGLALRLDGELAAIEIDGTSVRCGGGASLAAVVRRATDAGAARHRVRLRHPRHGRRGGAHERRRLRQRDPRRARRGRGGLGRRGRAAAGRPSSSSATATRTCAGPRSWPRRRCELAARRREEIRERCAAMQGRRTESQPRKARTFGSVFKNPDERPGRGRADRGAAGSRATSSAARASRPCTRTSSRTSATRARPTSWP